MWFKRPPKICIDWVTSCLRKRPLKEQITICTDSQSAVAAVATSGIKSLLVADCMEKLTVMSEINHETITWVPGHRGIQQNETVTGKRGRELGPDLSVQNPSYHYP